MSKAALRGNYITKVGHLDIYMKLSIETDKETKKTRTSSHKFDIYHAKRLVEGGHKTKDEAVARAKSLVAENLKKSRHEKP